MQVSPLRCYKLRGFFFVCHGEHDAFLVGLYAQEVEHPLHGRSAPVQRHGERKRKLFAYLRQRPERFGIDYGYNVIHAPVFSQSSIISKSPYVSTADVCLALNSYMKPTA